MKWVIEDAIKGATERLGFPGVSFVIEHPADLSHGDFATNVAMVSAKSMGKNPREVAEQFREALKGNIPQVVSIEIAGPGFINFRLARNFFSEKTTEINSAGETWGTNTICKDAEIVFEYTSPNLFKPLHIGNLVGNIVGESISRLFEFSGATVHRVNYPSDIGLTVAKGVWGLLTGGGNPDDITEIGVAYKKGADAYENDSQAKEEIEAVNRALYTGAHDELNELRNRGIETSRKHLAVLCNKLGTRFDAEIFESEASGVGTAIVREHVGHVFEESEGAIIYRGEKHGLHTRVFLNSQGLPTYEAKDLGNFALKTKKFPNWNQYFVVTGNEQREYFKVLIKALCDVFPDSLGKHIEHISTGFLTLTTGKMSSRKGNVLTGESLIEEVEDAAQEKAKESRAPDLEKLSEIIAIGALKYQILRQAPGMDIIFDKARALSFEGDSGPYLQYTHARIASILENAHSQGIVESVEHIPSSVYTVEKILYQFPEIVEKAQTERAPHYLVTYLTALAGSFNTLYAHEKIVDETDQFTPYKIALASAVRTTLRNGLYLLGIKAPEKM